MVSAWSIVLFLSSTDTLNTQFHGNSKHEFGFGAVFHISGGVRVDLLVMVLFELQHFVLKRNFLGGKSFD